MNYYHQCKEVTIEISNIKQIPADQLGLFWDYHKHSLLNFIKHLGQGISADWQDQDTAPTAVEILTIPGLKIPVKSTYPVLFYPLSEGRYDICLHGADSTDTLRNVTVEKNRLTDIDRIPVKIAAEKSLPDHFALTPPYPNPFNPLTRFMLQCLKEGYTELRIYDIRGRQIDILYEGFLPAGSHTFLWNGTNRFGKTVSSGIYIIYAKKNERTVRQKTVLIR